MRCTQATRSFGRGVSGRTRHPTLDAPFDRSASLNVAGILTSIREQLDEPLGPLPPPHRRDSPPSQPESNDRRDRRVPRSRSPRAQPSSALPEGGPFTPNSRTFRLGPTHARMHTEPPRVVNRRTPQRAPPEGRLRRLMALATNCSRSMRSKKCSIQSSHRDRPAGLASWHGELVCVIQRWGWQVHADPLTTRDPFASGASSSSDRHVRTRPPSNRATSLCEPRGYRTRDIATPSLRRTMRVGAATLPATAPRLRWPGSLRPLHAARVSGRH